MPDILTPEQIAELANSRNFFRSTPSGQRIRETVQTEERPPLIDIGEPGREPDAEYVELVLGEYVDTPFWYDVGIPPAGRYWVEFYFNIADRNERRNIYGGIQTILYPTKPIQNTNDREQQGTASFFTPQEQEPILRNNATAITTNGIEYFIMYPKMFIR